MTDRAASSVGFVLAGVALAASLSGWPGGLGPFAAVLSAIGLGIFGLRRYDRLEAGPADAVAAVAGLGATGVWVSAVVLAAGDGGATGLLSLPALSAVGGIGVAVMAYADWRGVESPALAAKASKTAAAAAVGISGLFAIFVWTVVIGIGYQRLTGEIDPTTGAVLSTVALGLATGSVAWFYLRVTGRGLGFIDLRRPDRRDAVYVIGGIVLLIGLNYGVQLVFQTLGLEAAQHSLFDIAREEPRILLVLIPLSYLLVGPGEELLYRNIVQKSLYDTFSRSAAIVVGSVIFAVVHVPAYSSAGSTPLSILNTLTVVFALALVLGVAYDRTRNVLVTALIHGSFNAIGFAITYVELAG